MCTGLLPPGANPTAVKILIIIIIYRSDLLQYHEKHILKTGILLVLNEHRLFRLILHKHKIDIYLYVQLNNVMTSYTCSVLIIIFYYF